jgi:FkbM family methyltransferase
VVAFEPLPANLERLRANLALNGLSERVQVVAAAVGETSGHQRFRLHSSVAMGKLIQPNETGDAVLDVKVVSLDDLAAERVQPPNLLKMDIEGGEVAALRGMRRMLRDAGPMLLIEIHGAQAAKGVWGEFQLADYAVYRLGGGVSRLTSAPEVRERGHLLGLPASRSGEVVGA